MVRGLQNKCGERLNMDRPFKLLLVFLISSLIFLGFGIYIYYGLDSAIDYNILHEQIMTNQTFVDEMTCDKIILTRDILPFTTSPTQQDEIEQLKIDFERLYQQKGCADK